MDTENLFNGDQPEARSVAFSDMEVAKDGWSFDGLLSVYDSETDLGSHIESFARGAYRKVLANGDNVPMVYHHNDTLPVLATTQGGTLSLKDDAKGLRVRADLAQHYVGEAVRELVRRGDIKGMSPGFIAGRGNSKVEQRNGRVYRTIVGLKKLLDVSVTWDPAYKSTTAEMRSLRLAEQTDALVKLRDVLAMGNDTQQLSKEQYDAIAAAVVEMLSGQLGGVASLDDQTSQSTDGGAHQQPVGEATQDPEADAGTGEDEDAPAGDALEQQEQRSGVDPDPYEVEAAARQRRLQMMGLSLPRGL